VLRIKLKQ